MATVTGQLMLRSKFRQLLANAPGANYAEVPISAKFTPSTGGVLADQVDLKHTRRYTFAAAAQVLDLRALLDVEGAAVAFARVRSLAFRFSGGAEGDTLKLGYATTTANAWTSLVSNPGQVTLQASSTPTNDAFFAFTAPGATGYLVGTANRLLVLDPGSASFTLDLEITGCSA